MLLLNENIFPKQTWRQCLRCVVIHFVISVENGQKLNWKDAMKKRKQSFSKGHKQAKIKMTSVNLSITLCHFYFLYSF